MTKQAKVFMLGLEQCRLDRGMVWHGDLPEEIRELLQLPSDFKYGWLGDIYVWVEPPYEAKTPEWVERKEEINGERVN